MDQLAKQFAELADKFGPQVAEAAMSAVRVAAYSTLMNGLLLFAVAAACAFGARLMWSKIKAGDWVEEAIIGPVLLLVAAGVTLTIGLWCWVDPWTWAAVAHPELWLAKRAFHL